MRATRLERVKFIRLPLLVLSSLLGSVSQSTEQGFGMPRWCIISAVSRLAVDRYQVLTDKQWELLELLLPKSVGRVGRNFSNNRLVVEGMQYRLRTSSPWRDLPQEFGPWQTVWKRHRRYAADGTWIECWPRCWPWPTLLVIWTGWPRSTPRSRCTSTARAPDTTRCQGYEPADHAIGRSRGGLTTKVHLVADGHGRGLAVLLTPGQAGPRHWGNRQVCRRWVVEPSRRLLQHGAQERRALGQRAEEERHQVEGDREARRTSRTSQRVRASPGSWECSLNTPGCSNIFGSPARRVVVHLRW
ncbi:IS5 family transposase [Nocardia gipuzkoensis]